MPRRTNRKGQRRSRPRQAMNGRFSPERIEALFSVPADGGEHAGRAKAGIGFHAYTLDDQGKQQTPGKGDLFALRRVGR